MEGLSSSSAIAQKTWELENNIIPMDTPGGAAISSTTTTTSADDSIFYYDEAGHVVQTIITFTITRYETERGRLWSLIVI